MALIFAVSCLGRVAAAPLTPGTILVSNFAGGTLAEYTRSGTFVQQFSVPDVDGDPFRDLRDAVVDASGKVQIYNGTFDPFLSTLNPGAGTFEHHTFGGWSTVNNISFGGIGTLGNFAFVTDMRTGGADEAKGIIRFNLADFSATRFAAGDGYQDLTIGRDGLLYALPGESLSALSILVFDPTTLALVRTIPLALELFLADLRGIAVDADGSIYAAAWNGRIFKVSGTGSVLGSLPTGASNLTDIDIGAGGELLAGSRFGDVILTTTSLTSFDSFVIGGRPTIHVAFSDPPQAAPEPSSIALLAACLLAMRAFAGHWRRRDTRA